MGCLAEAATIAYPRLQKEKGMFSAESVERCGCRLEISRPFLSTGLLAACSFIPGIVALDPAVSASRVTSLWRALLSRTMLRLPLATTSTLASSLRQAASTSHHVRYTSTSERSLPSTSIAHHKHSFRGGQNLSDRYKRLEKSLRGKMDRTEAMAHEHEQAHSDDLTSPTPVQGAALGNTFRGFVIPKEPRPPESDGACVQDYQHHILIDIPTILCVSNCRMLHVWLCHMRLRPVR